MNALYDKRFLKDIEAVNDKHLKQQVEKIISEIEKTEQLNLLHNLKKMKGHKSAYRIRIGNHRLGFFFENQKIILTRLLNRKDIYKYFP
ncbi:MAG: type II toxin-antitoxin system RelE/ParE family toxin [Bacteroidetes bacterium]|nr:type II toxin-antitoxin system RelE/ParE family toxin [Bacteroidota bacterium]